MCSASKLASNTNVRQQNRCTGKRAEQTWDYQTLHHVRNLIHRTTGYLTRTSGGVGGRAVTILPIRINVNNRLRLPDMSDNFLSFQCLRRAGASRLHAQLFVNLGLHVNCGILVPQQDNSWKRALRYAITRSSPEGPKYQTPRSPLGSPRPRISMSRQVVLSCEFATIFCIAITSLAEGCGRCSACVCHSPR